MRDVKIVKELCSVNTQVQEQYFSELRRHIYFLNSQQPDKLMFLHNCEIRCEQLNNLERLLTGTGLTPAAEDGRLHDSETKLLV